MFFLKGGLRKLTHITFSYEKALPFIKPAEIDQLSPFVQYAHKALHTQAGSGHDFLGWVYLPESYDRDEFSRIKKTAKKIKQKSDVLLVIGIGGSYLRSEERRVGKECRFWWWAYD